MSKSPPENRFEVLDIDTQEEGNKETTHEMENQESDPPVNVPQQEKEDQDEGLGGKQN